MVKRVSVAAGFSVAVILALALIIASHGCAGGSLSGASRPLGAPPLPAGLPQVQPGGTELNLIARHIAPLPAGPEGTVGLAVEWPRLPGADYAGPYSRYRQPSATQLLVEGADYTAQAGQNNYTEGGSAYVIVPGADDPLAFAQYSIADLDLERPTDWSFTVTAAPIVPGGDDELPLNFLIGISNYSNYTWEWRGPYSTAESVVLNSTEVLSRYISAGHTLSVVVATLVGPQYATPGNPDGLTAARIETSEFTVQPVTAPAYHDTAPHFALLAQPAAKGASALDPAQYVTLSWEHVTDPTNNYSNEADTYEIRRMQLGDTVSLLMTKQSAHAGTNTYTDDGTAPGLPAAVPGQTYIYYLRAENEAGYCAFDQWEVTIPLMPPGNLQASQAAYADRVVLTWEAAGGATGYEIYRDAQANLLDTLGAVTTYEDLAITDNAHHSYWLKTLGPGGLESGFSAEAVGYAGIAPVAALSADPPQVQPGLVVNFDASGSTDADGTVTGFVWDWTSDGTYDFDSGSDATVSHSYPASGDYTVTVRVTDNDGITDTAATLVMVNLPPTANYTVGSGQEIGSVPHTVDFDAGSSTDTDGTLEDYEWDFDGDGTYNETDNGEDLARGDTTPSYTYTVQGSYNPALRVTDDDGALDAFSMTIMANLPPVAQLTADPLAGGPPLNVDFDASGSSDPDGTIEKYEWDWTTDGTYDFDSGTDSSVAHTYATSGEYTASVRVTDDGAFTDTANVALSINLPPAADLDADAEYGPAPLTVSFDAGDSHDTDGSMAQYEFDFGEGAGWFDNGADPTLQHVYSTAGLYAARVRVTDDDGAASSALKIIDTQYHRRWESLTSMPNMRDSAAAATDGLYAYVFGGAGIATAKKIDAYNLASGNWTAELYTIPDSREYAAGALYNGDLYIIGGSDGAASLATTQILDLATGTWSAGPTLTYARHSAGVVVVQGALYVLGGVDTATGNDIAQVEMLPCPGASFEYITDMSPAAKHGFGVAAIEGDIYAIGGRYGATDTGTAAVYHSAADSWEALTDLPNVGTSAGYPAMVFDGRVFVVNGLHTQRYDPADDSWREMEAPPSSYTRECGVQAGVRMLDFRGNSGVNCRAYSSLTDFVWHSYSMDLIAASYMGSPIQRIGSYPAIAFSSSAGSGYCDNPKLKYARATTTSPASSTDWQAHEIDDDAWFGGCDMVELGGRPAICYSSVSNFSLKFAWANTAYPSSASDWLVYSIDSSAAGTWPKMTFCDGKPVIAYIGSAGAMFARATTTTPTSSSDWIYYIVHDNGASGTNFGMPGAICILNGKPVMAYTDMGSLNDLWVALALTATPNSESDWAKHIVTSDCYSGDNSGYLIAIETYGNKLGITYMLSPTGTSRYARSLTSNPASSGDWVIHSFSFYNFRYSMTSYYSQPVFTRHDATILFASSAEPSAEADWDSTTALSGTHWQSRILFDRGKPVITFADYIGGSYAYGPLYYAWTE